MDSILNAILTTVGILAIVALVARGVAFLCHHITWT